MIKTSVHKCYSIFRELRYLEDLDGSENIPMRDTKPVPNQVSNSADSLVVGVPLKKCERRTRVNGPEKLLRAAKFFGINACEPLKEISSFCASQSLPLVQICQS